MNNTTADATGGFLSSGKIGGFGYGIGVSVGILLLITTITLASYYCTKNNNNQTAAAGGGGRRRGNGGTNGSDPNHDAVVVVDVGLDETTLLSYPKVLYSEVKNKDSTSTSTATCCSICLADYKNSDTLRLLPDCGHLFHLKCVDPWLRLHPTCPVCRTSPLPTPVSTPLAEVIPLASRPIR